MLKKIAAMIVIIVLFATTIAEAKTVKIRKISEQKMVMFRNFTNEEARISVRLESSADTQIIILGPDGKVSHLLEVGEYEIHIYFKRDGYTIDKKINMDINTKGGPITVDINNPEFP